MRAVVVSEFGGIENASLGDMPKPAPKAGEVLLEVHAVSRQLRRSRHDGRQLPVQAGAAVRSRQAAGRRGRAVGDGVTKFKPGDRALLMAEAGGFAEFAVMPESQCVKLPAALPFTEAAAMALVYDTAYFALKDRGRIAAGRHRAGARRDRRRRPRRDPAGQGVGAPRCLPRSPARTRTTSCARPAPTRSIDLSAPDLHESLRAQVFAQTDEQRRRHHPRHAGRRHLRCRGARAGLVRAADRDRLRLRPHPVAEDELRAGQEHRSQRHADQRLPQAPAGRHAGVRSPKSTRCTRRASSSRCRPRPIRSSSSPQALCTTSRTARCAAGSC